MSPLEIWCNESQERYVLAVAPEQLPLFDELCRRERAPLRGEIGEATEALHLSLDDAHFDDRPIDLPLDVLLGKTPKMTRDVQTLKAQGQSLQRGHHFLLPTRCESRAAPADGRGENLPRHHWRSHRHRYWWRRAIRWWGRGRFRWLDCAVTTASLAIGYFHGEAMSIGERAPVGCWTSPPPPVWLLARR